jgi:hypothetical protein
MRLEDVDKIKQLHDRLKELQTFRATLVSSRVINDQLKVVLSLDRSGWHRSERGEGREEVSIDFPTGPMKEMVAHEITRVENELRALGVAFPGDEPKVLKAGDE